MNDPSDLEEVVSGRVDRRRVLNGGGFWKDTNGSGSVTSTRLHLPTHVFAPAPPWRSPGCRSSSL